MRLVTVLGHSDLYSNDCADAGATAVVKGDVKATVTEPADNAPYDRHYWLRNQDNNQYVCDLNQGIIRILPIHTLARYTNDTVYTQQWGVAATSLCAKTSNAYLLTQRTCHWLTKQVLDARYGYMYNAKLQQLYGRGGDGKCPVCRHCRAGGPIDDSGGQILGGARPTMKGVYRTRHNAAVRTLVETIHNGKHGGEYLIMDAGRRTCPRTVSDSASPPGCCCRRMLTPLSLEK